MKEARDLPTEGPVQKPKPKESEEDKKPIKKAAGSTESKGPKDTTCEEKLKSMVPKSDTIAGMSSQDFLGDLKKSVAQAPQKVVEIQLNWSEYYQGQWTTRESSGFGKPISAPVGQDFDRSMVFISAYEEWKNPYALEIKEEIDKEHSVIINLFSDRPGNIIKKAFRVVSKNSQPKIEDGHYPPMPLHNESMYGDTDATHYKYHDKPLIVVIHEDASQEFTKKILRKCKDFSLSMYSNLSYVYSNKIDSRFFYQDRINTFFVEPQLPEPAIQMVEDYGFFILPHEPELYEADRFKEIPLVAQVPDKWKGPDGDPIDELARYKIQPKEDWVTDPATVFQFGEHLVGQRGRVDMEILPAAAGVLAPGSALETTGGSRMVSGGIPLSSRGLNVIVGSGLKGAMLENIGKFRGSGAVQSLPGI